jgi:hypothetical protein
MWRRKARGKIVEEYFQLKPEDWLFQKKVDAETR